MAAIDHFAIATNLTNVTLAFEDDDPQQSSWESYVLYWLLIFLVPAIIILYAWWDG